MTSAAQYNPAFPAVEEGKHKSPYSYIQPGNSLPEVRNLLVADRSPDINQLLQLILENDRIKVHTATYADKAIRIARTCKIHIFIIDANMPGPQGALSLHKFFCETDPFRKIPLLLVTGVLGSVSTSTLHRKGVDGLINKPFTIKEVKAAVLRILAESR